MVIDRNRQFDQEQIPSTRICFFISGLSIKRLQEPYAAAHKYTAGYTPPGTHPDNLTTAASSPLGLPEAPEAHHHHRIRHRHSGGPAYGGGQLGITEDGLQQQYVLVEDKRLVEIPAGYSIELAAALPINYVTAYQAMTRVGQIEKGQKIAITGATGSVGHALIQTANILGATPIAIVSSSEKIEHAKQSGAKEVINLSTQDLEKSLHDITDGKGVDIAFDQVGGELLGKLVKSIRPRGTVVSICFVAGIEAKIVLPDLLVQKIKLLGYDAWMETDEDVEQVMKIIQSFAAEGKLRPSIDSVYTIEEFDTAYKKLCSRTAKGTILIKLNDD